MPGMNPEVRARPSRATAMTTPRNQSAFQNAVFMALPCSPRAPFPRRPPVELVCVAPSYRDTPPESASQVERTTQAPIGGQFEEMGGDRQVLDRHALRLEERDLVGSAAPRAGTGDDLPDLDEPARGEPSLVER